MKIFVGLDVSVKTTTICAIDGEGAMVREGKVVSEPEAIIGFLAALPGEVIRIGLEAGPLSQWLHQGLREAGLPAVCIETRRAKAFLSAQINKSDRHDARGIAQMMRLGVFQPVHVKSQRSQELRVLLIARKLMQSKLQDMENELRCMLRNFGLKVGTTPRTRFEARIRELVAGHGVIAETVEPVLTARRGLLEAFDVLHRQVRRVARQDRVCRLLMTMPGVGEVVALTYRATIDDPMRFKRSKTVGVHLGLTPRRYQSGETDWSGRISKCGDGLLRAALYEAALVAMTRVKRWSWLRSWALRVARRRGAKRAVVALARRMAVILHRMWVGNTPFRWSREPEAQTA